MKYSTPLVTTLFAFSASAQSPTAAQSTLTVVPKCASAAPDMIVTRSAVVASACTGSSNATAVPISGFATMSGGGGMMGSATGSGMPAEFTGGASGASMGSVLVGGVGVLAALLI